MMINYEKGEINHGDYAFVADVMARAERGENIKVGFLGGSITQGSLSSVPETCYAYLVYKWWKDTFKNADIQYINAGIGGTTSQFGAARVKEQVLRYEPDFLLIEFAVNDENNAFFMETYEGLIRCVLNYKKAPALLLMNNVMYDNGLSAEEIHLKLAKHYNLPMVSMKTTILPEISNGNIANRDITPDDLHPNDKGHKMIADVIIHELNKIKDSAEECYVNQPAKTNIQGQADITEQTNMQGQAASRALPAPMTQNGYEYSRLLNNKNAEPLLDGFEKDTREKENFLDLYKNGWTAGHTGDKIVFNVEGTGIALQYRKSVNKPAPVAEVIIDDDVSTKKMLNSNFNEDWGDCLFIETITQHMELKTHKAEIKITEAHEDDAVPFYLVSLIVSGGGAAL